MKKINFKKTIALSFCVLAAACIGNDDKGFLDEAFKSLSETAPTEDMVGGWTFLTRFSENDDSAVCGYFTLDGDAYEVETLIAEDGSCTATIDALSENAEVECAADDDQIIITISATEASGDCVYTKEEIISTTKTAVGEFSGTFTGQITLSGDCGTDSDGAEIVTGTCGYTGTATLQSAADEDADNDGFASDEDCDDTDATINPDATEILDNSVDEDCDGVVGVSATTDDADEDGFTADEDCDDTDNTINPDAEEILDNEVDENCDGVVGASSDDVDEDGFTTDDDCDDTDATINPDAEEILDNEVDENCDGVVGVTGDCVDGDQACDEDLDNDGLCDVADNCNGNAIDPDEDYVNDWYWVDTTNGSNYDAETQLWTFVDGTYDGDTIVVYGVVDGFKAQNEIYSYCGIFKSAMVGICVEKNF